MYLILPKLNIFFVKKLQLLLNTRNTYIKRNYLKLMDFCFACECKWENPTKEIFVDRKRPMQEVYRVSV